MVRTAALLRVRTLASGQRDAGSSAPAAGFCPSRRIWSMAHQGLCWSSGIPHSTHTRTRAFGSRKRIYMECTVSTEVNVRMTMGVIGQKVALVDV